MVDAFYDLSESEEIQFFNLVILQLYFGESICKHFFPCFIIVTG